MKRFFLLCMGLWLAIFALPLFCLGGERAVLPEPSTQANEPIDQNTTITVLRDGVVEELTLEEYLCGVVAAEMPALFPEEALKAQAVAARTYTMKRAAEDADTSHKGAMVCANPNHCKAYQPIAEFTAHWGTSGESYTEKIQKAVRDTDGEILLYENQPISAVFHSSSDGKTERAADVWGRDVPYLQSVESVGDDAAPNFESTVTVPRETFIAKVKETYGNADFSGATDTWFSDFVRSDAGGVKTVCVGGVNISGRDLRVMFSLRSTHFSVEVQGENIIFTTRGYGHGVGMSQYGAQALAKKGMDYRAILAHYYRKTTLGKIKIEKQA